MLHLETHLIDNHARRKRTDFLQDFQSIFPQCRTSLHDIYNHLRQIHKRCQLHRTIQLDNLNRLVFLLTKIILCNIRIFTRYTDNFIFGKQFPSRCWSANAHPALAKAKIQHFITSYRLRPSSMIVSFPTTPISAAPYST